MDALANTPLLRDGLLDALQLVLVLAEELGVAVVEELAVVLAFESLQHLLRLVVPEAHALSSHLACPLIINLLQLRLKF